MGVSSAKRVTSFSFYRRIWIRFMGVRPMGRGKSAMWMAGLGGPPNGGHRGLAPAGGIVHAGCAPHFLFETSKRKCAAPGGKENMFGGSACAGAALLPPAGEGWQSLAAVRDGNAPPLGKPPARGGTGIPPAPLPAAAHAPAKNQAAPSEAEGAEREAGRMHPCTLTLSAPSATGQQSRPRRR